MESPPTIGVEHRPDRPDVLGRVAAVMAVGFCLAEAWLGRTELTHAAPLILGLGLPAAAAAWLARWRGADGSPRLALAYLLAALLLLPLPGALLVALLALAGGRGGGIAGPWSAGPKRVAPLVLAVALAGLLVRAADALPPQGSVASLLPWVLACFALLEAIPLVVAGLLDGPRRGLVWRAPVVDLLTLPLALVLLPLAAAGSWPAFAVLSAAVLAAVHYHRASRDARRGLRRAESALALRDRAVGSLRRLGIEIARSRDAAPVFSIIERECAATFDQDFFMLALTDPSTSRLQAVFRRRRGEAPQLRPLSLGEGLASRVLATRRPLRIDDLDAPRNPVPIHLVAEDAKSALVVPLMVQDRAIGVLSVQSRRAAAWNDASLQALQVVAQLAALAVDGLRHQRKATHDSLTGMYHRDYFFRRVRDEYRRMRRYGGSFAVLMIDLDGFKTINDRHGHISGDRYLAAFGNVVRRVLRGADLACRFGGDEFCLLLPETDTAGAHVIAERLRAAVARMSVRVDRVELRTTVSIGLAAFPDHDTGDLNDLLRRADEALYRAKRTGRDRVVPYAA